MPTSITIAVAPVLLPIVILWADDAVPISNPPDPASKTKFVAPVLFPTVIVLAAAPVPTFISWASASFPIPIAPALEFNSKTPSASKSNVSSEFIVISPVPVDAKAIFPVPEFIAIAVAPVTLPIVIVLAAAPVPKLIASAEASA